VCTDAGTQCLYDSSTGLTACKPCGGVGQPCCPTSGSTYGSLCKDPGTACDTSTSTSGVCKVCGAAGGPCCANNTCNDPGTLCKSSLCAVCGTPGAACCNGNTCTSGCCVTRYGGTSYGQTCVAAGSACDTLVTSTTGPLCDVTTVATGTCATSTTACGGLGQACCTSTYSTSTSYYFCGAAGSRCLYSSSTGTVVYSCTACGDRDQRCCLDNSYSTPTATGCKSPYLCTYETATGYSYCRGSAVPDAGAPPGRD